MLQNDRQWRWRVFSQRSVGQLAQTGAAKHGAVDMATEEHFPPRSATETENQRERWSSALLLRPFVAVGLPRVRVRFERSTAGIKGLDTACVYSGLVLHFVVEAVWTIRA